MLFKRACKVCCAWLCYFCGAVFAVTIVGCLVGLACIAYLKYISDISVPATVYQACVDRVSSNQADLFVASNLQPNSSLHSAGNKPTFHHSLCNPGFVGNSDIYGLGVRSGLYIQWASSLLANHLLREERTALMGSYLIFHIALWIAVAVLTFQKICTFAVEVVLLYYLVYGGFVCVFIRPNLGDFEPAMMDLHWSRGILLLSYLTMGTHVVWFIVFGRFSFPNMPCGTTIFFFGPVKDDWMDLLAILLGPGLFSGILFLAFLMCGFCFIFAGQILESITESPLYKGLYPRVRHRTVVQLQSASPRYHRSSRMFEWLAAQRERMRNNYGPVLTRYFSTYTMSRPLHGQHRRVNQMAFLAIGLFTLVWSILAIELTIHWNNISGMYALDSSGQYVPLVVGLGGFVRLLYGGLKLWLNPNRNHSEQRDIELVSAQSHEAAASLARSGNDALESLNVGPSHTSLERRVATF